MIRACLLLIPLAFVLAAPLTLLVRQLSRRLNAMDSVGVAGQNKARRRVPNTGGIAIFWAVVLPIVLGLAAVHLAPDLMTRLIPDAAAHLGGVKAQTGLAVSLLVSIGLLHVLGLIDDRRPLGPFLKLAIMAAPAIWIASTSDTRLLTLLDSRV